MLCDYSRLETDTKMVCPFVCHIVPLVCYKNTSALPLIGNNIPLIRFYVHGFTLIELIVAVTIAGILSALAAPALTTLITNQRLSSQANELMSDLAFSRSEAVRRAGSGTSSAGVTICKSANPNAAAPNCNATTGDAWTSGRIVFIDINGDGIRDTGDEILRIRQELEGASANGNQLIGDSNSSGTAKRITYKSSGATNLALGSEYQLTFCDKRGDNQGRAVAMHPLGRARVVERGKNTDGSAITVCP